MAQAGIVLAFSTMAKRWRWAARTKLSASGMCRPLKRKAGCPTLMARPRSRVSADGKMMAVSEQKADAITLWDVSGASPKQGAKLKDSGLFYRLSFSHDGKKLAASNDAG